jgi:hypothetical protein
MATARKPIASLRWWIGGLLFASTVINYIDRQTCRRSRRRHHRTEDRFLVQ